MVYLEVRADNPVWQKIGFDELAITSVIESIDAHWGVMLDVSGQMDEPDLFTDLASQFSSLDISKPVHANIAYLMLHKINQFGSIISAPEDTTDDDIGYLEASRLAALGWLIKLRNYCRDTPDSAQWTTQGYANYQPPEA